MYSIIYRPGNEIGYSIFEYSMNNTISTDYFLHEVDQVSLLLSQFEILVQKFQCKLPAVGPKLLSDSLGFFWGDIKHCRLTIDEFKNKRLSFLYYSMITLESFKQIKINKRIVIDSAKEQWKI